MPTPSSRRGALLDAGADEETGADNPVGDTGPLTRTWTGRPVSRHHRLRCVWAPASPPNSYHSLVFVPGYGRGARPHGVFAVRAVLAPRSWTHDAVNDVAMAVV